VSDGAALVFFSEKSKENDFLPPIGQNWVDVANDLTKSVFSAYLEITTDVSSRTKIRQTLQARERNPYKGKSGPHQSLVHVHALFRMGLIAKENGAHSRQYKIDLRKGADNRPLKRLVDVVPNVEELERVIGARGWPSVARAVFLPDVKEQPDEPKAPTPAFLNQVRSIYDQVMSTGVNLCPLTTLIEAIQIKLLASESAPMSYSAAFGLLKKAQNDYPNDIRFHVDRYGRPAFLKLGP